MLSEACITLPMTSSTHQKSNKFLSTRNKKNGFTKSRSSFYECWMCVVFLRMFFCLSKNIFSTYNSHYVEKELYSKPDISAKIAAYNLYRKNLKKETLKCLKSLKGMKGKSDISNVDHSIKVVVEVLREVRVATIAIVESLLSLISIPCLDQGSSGMSFLRSTFLRSSGRSLYGFCDETALHSANKRLKAVEIAVEDLEVELECMTRQGCTPRYVINPQPSIRGIAGCFAMGLLCGQ